MTRGMLSMPSLSAINVFLFNILFAVGIRCSLDKRNFISLSRPQNSSKVLKVAMGGLKLAEISIGDDHSSEWNASFVQVTDGLRLAEFVTRGGNMKDCRLTSSIADIKKFTQMFCEDLTPVNKFYSLQNLHKHYVSINKASSFRATNNSHLLISPYEIRSIQDKENTHISYHRQNPKTMLALIKSKRHFRSLFGGIVKYFDVLRQIHICKGFGSNPHRSYSAIMSNSTSAFSQSKSDSSAFSHNIHHFGCNRFCSLRNGTSRRHKHLSSRDQRNCYRQCVSSLLSSPSKINQDIITPDMDPINDVITTSSTSSSSSPSSSNDSQKQYATRIRYTQNNKMSSNVNENSGYDKNRHINEDNDNNNNYTNNANANNDNNNNEYDSNDDDKVVNMKTTPRQSQSRQKRDLFTGWMIFPGTKWCGDGDIAEHKKDLGYHRKLDRCCRRHDLCPVIIPRLTSKYGMFNYRPHTLSHCRCDRKFRKCLQATDTPISNLIGRIYFNVIGPKCFKFKEETACVERFWWGACSRWGNKKVASLKRQRQYRSGKYEKEKLSRKRDYLITNNVI